MIKHDELKAKALTSDADLRNGTMALLLIMSVGHRSVALTKMTISEYKNRAITEKKTGKGFRPQVIRVKEHKTSAYHASACIVIRQQWLHLLLDTYFVKARPQFGPMRDNDLFFCTRTGGNLGSAKDTYAWLKRMMWRAHLKNAILDDEKFVSLNASGIRRAWGVFGATHTDERVRSKMTAHMKHSKDVFHRNYEFDENRENSLLCVAAVDQALFEDELSPNIENTNILDEEGSLVDDFEPNRLSDFVDDPEDEVNPANVAPVVQKSKVCAKVLKCRNSL